MSSLLSAQSLACERAYRSLFTDISFDVRRGEVLRIAGPNGAGKSSLLNILCGLSSDYSGQLFWRGQSLLGRGRSSFESAESAAAESGHPPGPHTESGHPPSDVLSDVKDDYRRSLCFLGHAAAVKAALTARENLQWFSSLYPCKLDYTIEQALADVGIGAYADSLCCQLSAGQQQRVALARLLLSAADLWILDEPFTAIDKQGVAVFEAIIDDFARAGGAVIITTHHTMQLSTSMKTLALGGGS